VVRSYYDLSDLFRELSVIIQFVAGTSRWMSEFLIKLNQCRVLQVPDETEPVVPDLLATNLAPLHPASVSPCTSKFQVAPVQAVLLFQIDLRAFGVMLKTRRREEFIVAAGASCHRRNSIPEPLNNLERTFCHEVSPDLDV
jgi:hypothetical protein